MTDKQGRFYEAIEYLPYGETLYNERTENDGVSYKYTGKEEDAETGLYYYGARYYDAKLCRFISVDPIIEGYLSGEPNGGVYWAINLSLYCYGAGNPILYNDPSGMASDIPMNPSNYSDDQYSVYQLYYNGTIDRSYQDNNYSLYSNPSKMSVLKDNVEAAFEKPILNIANDACVAFTGRNVVWREQPQGTINQARFNTLVGGALTFMTGGGASTARMASSAPRYSVRASQYSVAYKAKLGPGSFPGRTRGVHFNRANKALSQTMAQDAAFAKGMEETIPGISEFFLKNSYSSPTTLGWTWHHAAEAGAMELVPYVRHTSPFMQNLFHPGGIGGFSIWGR